MSQLAPQVPERVIIQALRIGVGAIVAELTGPNPPAPGRSLLASILRGANLDDELCITNAELAKLRQRWTTNAPSTIAGYARESSPFPLFAVTLGGESTSQEYIGQGILDCIDEAEITGAPAEFGRRLAGNYMIFVYAQHPDIVVWNYRIARHILNVATLRFIRAGLQEPRLTGADLMPEPKYTPDNLYVRRLTVEVEYNEAWSDQTPLWDALNGAPAARLPPGAGVNVRHRFSDPFPGTVDPYVVDDDQEA